MISRTGLALLVFVGLAGAFPSAVNWGGHFWGFLPLPVPVVLGALMALALLPSVQDRLLAALGRLVASFSAQTRARTIVLWTVVLAGAALVFWTFRQRTFFLGDGYLVQRTLPVAVSSGDIPASFPTAPLTGYLAAHLFSILRSVGAADPARDAWQTLSVLSGLIAVPSVWWLAGSLTADGKERLALTILIIGGGATMLFFGYIETYAPAYAVMLATIAAAQEAYRGDRSVMLVSLLFVILVFLHVGMVILGPMLLFVYAGTIRSKGWRALAMPIAGGTLVVAIILLLLWYSPQGIVATFLRDGTSFLPLTKADGWNESYTLFSLWHWVDLLNLHLLVSPYAIVLAGGLFAGAFVPARYRQPGMFFWIALATPALLWLFLNNFELGMSRDWDLAAPFAATIGLGGLASWLGMMGPSETRTRGVVVMAMVTLVQTVGWVGVNAGVNSSLMRFDSLLDFRSIPPRAMAIACEEVGDYRRARGDARGAVAAFAQSAALDSTNARRWTVLANAEAMTGDLPGARLAYERAIRLGSADPEVHMNLGVMLFRQGDIDGALGRLQEAAAMDSTDPDVTFTLGEMLVEGKGDLRGALPWFERTLRLDPGYRHARAYADRCRAAADPSTRPE